MPTVVAFAPPRVGTRITTPRLIDLFVAEPRDPFGCWVWPHGKDSTGYGLMSGPGSVPRRVYRAMYEANRGSIPPGMEPDHLCEVKACVNPWHLEIVTPRVNLLRARGAPAINARKTACPRGHEYDKVLLNGWRRCTRCDLAKSRRRSARFRTTEAVHVPH